jgi:photosystem II stability/assembly factor-like uncharacterized protein
MSAPVRVLRFALHLNYATGGPDFVDPANGWWLDTTPLPEVPALWRTADGGRTWRLLPASGLPDDLPLAQPVFVDRLAGAIVSGHDEGRLLRPDGSRLWASDDEGRTWQARPLNLPSSTQAVAVESARAGVLIIAALRQRSAADRDVPLFRGADGGVHWTEIHLPHRADAARFG